MLMNTKKSIIMVVDDIELNRNVLKDWVEVLGHDYMEADNGKSALEKIEVKKPDLVLLDIMMPVMDGITMLKHLKSRNETKDIPVLLVSADANSDTIVKGIQSGADDYLVKPFKPAILKARIASSLEKKILRDLEKEHIKQIRDINENLKQLVDDQVEEIVRGQSAMTFAICKMAESRDPETGEHLDRMREYCKLLAQQLQKRSKYEKLINQEFIDTLYKASPLHDIGKIGIPDSILQKPGKLTDEEFDIMKTHASIGENSLEEVHANYPQNSVIAMGAVIAGKHHEKWDGSGYPNALKGEDIPLSARILALGDVYDALSSKRPYKEAFTHEICKKMILEGSKKHFDPEVVDAFLEIEDAFIEINERFSDK